MLARALQTVNHTTVIVQPYDCDGEWWTKTIRLCHDATMPLEREKPVAILRKNDLGGYTVPTHGLYPYQWSWDSAITALGWLQVDEARAWLEAETMLRGQWDNGMIPHILFHGNTDSYFPGPLVWGTDREIPSTAISQPPVWATVVRILFEQAKNKTLAGEMLARLLPKLVAYHRWWYRERDPENTGLVCSYHPWESGMDNSPAWDIPLANVPAIDWPYERRDLSLIDSDQRPKKKEYDRYLYLVDFYKQCGFDSDYIYQHCPYKVLDIGTISILHRATKDLLALCSETPGIEGTETLESSLQHTKGAIDGLWLKDKGCFASFDLLTGGKLDVTTSATVLPLFGQLASIEQADAMGNLLGEWLDATPYGLSSTHPDSKFFEPQRYWRGPVWLHINWMIADGLTSYGMAELAQRLRDSSRRCVSTAGFWEYFDALGGTGCGGNDFSWTAAIALHWLSD